ncbi:hypothetical protein L210DRAFT_3631429 [Boletus edulis BED1]|uniref:Uncharacterized protein n=1 Tax=Boletus edulis BED1 TaxID=1328754 RepID=A0AAD4BR09_BOLED|nr:hypothetical protein L210DRAFT_3631429 [Boletus edulis BED1]
MPPQRRIYIVRLPFQRRHLRVYTPTQFQLYSSSLRVVTKSCERSKSVVAQPAHTEMRACGRSPPTDSPAWEGRRYLERDTFDVFSLDDYTTDAPYPRYAFRKSWALVQRPHPMIGVPPAWTAFLDQKCRTALGYRFVNGWNLEQPVNAQVLQTFSHPIPVHVLSLQAIPMRAKARYRQQGRNHTCPRIIDHPSHGPDSFWSPLFDTERSSPIWCLWPEQVARLKNQYWRHFGNKCLPEASHYPQTTTGQECSNYPSHLV